jgi:rsbT co-antagonist protein RsbR
MGRVGKGRGISCSIALCCAVRCLCRLPEKEADMPSGSANTWHHVLAAHRDAVLKEWIGEQLSFAGRRSDLLTEADLRRESTEFLALVIAAAEGGAGPDLEATEWDSVRDFLSDLSRARVEQQGFSPSETAVQVFSLKKPLFKLLQDEMVDTETMLAERWAASAMIDKIGLYTVEVYLESRDAIIARQQHEMLELSTPVVQLWEGIIALPLIGTLDSTRTQVVMETLLQSIVDTGSRIAVIDITGVSTVDTLVAQHLIKTAAAARLMGAQCIISGIRPQIAQTMVHLGVGFEDVLTTGSIADALQRAFRMLDLKVTHRDAG